MTNSLSLRACVLILGAVLCPVPVAVTADEPLVPGRSEIAKPPMPMKDTRGEIYTGTVTEVTKDSITLLWPGEKEPKKFVASEILASGNYPKTSRPPLDGGPGGRTMLPHYRYRLADLKVGDQVTIIFAHLGGVDICDQISIRKRPGGQVPPLPEGAENLKAPFPLPPGQVILSLIPYHERMNAYWDLEEKGIPYPEKFGPFRRFPEAPLPREVTPGPPVAP